MEIEEILQAIEKHHYLVRRHCSTKLIKFTDLEFNLLELIYEVPNYQKDYSFTHSKSIVYDYNRTILQVPERIHKRRTQNDN